VFHLRAFIGIAAIASIMMFTAHAQVRQELFRAAPVYSFYDRGIIAAPLTTSGGRGEALKIIGSLEALLDLNRGKPAPPGGYGRQRGFEMRIGPTAIGPQNECSWTAEEISDLEKCFDGRPLSSSDAQIETVEVAVPENLQEFRRFVSRHKNAPQIYAVCSVHAPSGTQLSCEVIFEQAGLRHAMTASAGALRNLPLFRCTILVARTKIWPGGPRIAWSDSCP
jgi:hypothetical protein